MPRPTTTRSRSADGVSLVVDPMSLGPRPRRRGRLCRIARRRLFPGDQPQRRLGLRLRIELLGLILARLSSFRRDAFARGDGGDGGTLSPLPMKISTFNINGIKARLPRLIEWLEQKAPDVACLQEIKTSDETFPITDIEAAGYGAIWHGQKGFNGVAILARGTPADRAPQGSPARSRPQP